MKPFLLTALTGVVLVCACDDVRGQGPSPQSPPQSPSPQTPSPQSPSPQSPSQAPTASSPTVSITPNAIGVMGPGLVNRSLLQTVFLKDGNGTIEETSDVASGEVVGRAFTVKQGTGLESHAIAIAHVDLEGQLYTVEIVAPVADVNGVRVGDALGKALGNDDEPVRCARGSDDRQELVFCSRAKEPRILFTTKPQQAGQVGPDVLRALPITSIVWSPHAGK